MRFIDYGKERIYQLGIILTLLFIMETLLLILEGSFWIGVVLAFFAISVWFLILFLEFYRKKRYFDKIFECLEQLDKKYLIAEMVENGVRQEEVLLKEILRQSGKAMTEQVNQYKFAGQEYKEYIELWIHEVKLPIAAAKMMVENSRNEVTENIEEELNRIEEYTEQALFYARSSYVEKDYLIKKVLLLEVVNSVVLQNKKMLIRKKAQMNLQGLEKEVFSDSKWLAFILNQILSNSMKYADKEPLKLEIYAEEEKEAIRLFVRDNGMGIPQSEVSRVFEKGFTGEKGRRIMGVFGYRNQATGLGLFLCKELCKKLGHALSLESEEGIGTTVCIVFPKGSMTWMEK